MIKVSTYLARRLAEMGVRHVFMITGGGAMHLNDALGRHPDIEYICNHHEQACAMAAEGYARASGRMAVVNVTTGPGGLNTLTGLMGQWTDSVPVLYLSGQVKFETTLQSCPDLGLRQLGDQEVDIIRIVQPLTKFAHSVTDPRDIRKVFEQAVYQATHGRPGPVWIDLPMNVQGSLVDEASLEGYQPPPSANATSPRDELIDLAVAHLKNAKRPVIVVGHGVRIAGALEALHSWSERLQIPLLTTFNGFDAVASDNPLFIGRIGTIGTRAGNFALQNADVLLSIGSRNNIRQVSYGWQTFARSAVKIVVDVDAAELSKPTVKPDLAIESDALAFLKSIERKTSTVDGSSWAEWLTWCQVRRDKYPVVLPEYRTTPLVHPYVFIETLTRHATKDDAIVAGNGTACVALFQSGIVHEGQRLFWNSGCASMGYDLPASIGACIGRDKRSTICIAGDGSLQMNVQELQTVSHHKLPVKIFILSNDGYQSIKQTQANFFGMPYIGCSSDSGVSFPDAKKLAEAYGLPAVQINHHAELEEKIDAILHARGPLVCDVRLERNYTFSPKLSSEKKPDGRMVSKPLEDMYPFLERDEFMSNMIVAPWDPDAPATTQRPKESVKP